jgi:hypothetical protein
MATWQEIREKHPEQWVLIEAVDAYTEDEQRIVGNIVLWETCGSDWRDALAAYKRYHEKYPNRELYYLHTKRVEMDIRDTGRVRATKW